MKTVKIKILFLSILLLGAACSKKPGPSPSPAPVSIADKISGIFNGTGTNMPANENLGSSTGSCVVPANLTSFLKTGTAQLDVSKINDSTVNITFIGGPFASNESFEKSISQTGNTIVLKGGGLPEEALTYDVNTKVISVGIDTPLSFFNSGVLSSPCQQGLPYYYGFYVNGTSQITYLSLGYAQFSGTKQ